jgi:hypothetical protein
VGELAEALPEPSVFGVGGLLTYSDEQRVAATERAVTLLYRAGYDPRGLFSYLSLLKRQRDDSPFDAVLCARMMEKGREALSGLSPLLNPVVQSQDFLEIRRGQLSPRGTESSSKSQPKPKNRKQSAS